MDVYPFDLLPPASERWHLSGVTIDGGAPVVGPPTKSRTDGGGFWMAWMNGIELVERRQIKAARALDVVLDGGLGRIIVPAFDWVNYPAPVAHSDGAAFSDSGVYLSGMVAASLTAPAALRATRLFIRFVGVEPLEGGERFSILHLNKGKRLYTIGRVSDLGADQYQIEVRPPLREACDREAQIDFTTPGCAMHLANPADWLGELDAHHECNANIVWIEAP